MKFTIDSSELKRQLDIIAFIARDSFILKSKKATSDTSITAIITAKKDKLIIENANEGLSYIKVSVPAKVETPGKVVTDCTAFLDQHLRGKEVTVEDKGEQLSLQCGRLKASINKKSDSENAEEAIPEDKIKTTVTMKVKDVNSAIDKVIFSSIDTEIETSLPFIMSTTDKGKLFFSSLDHFCSSLYTVKKFEGTAKLKEMKCVPSGVLQKMLKSTNDENVELGFSEGQFIIRTKDILVMYPQPQYDLADITEAIKSLKAMDQEITFEFLPADMYNGIDEVGGMGDSADSKMELKLDGNKLNFCIEGQRGKAKSFMKVDGVKGKKTEFAVVYNVLYAFAAQITNVTEEKCRFSIFNNIVIIETLDSSIIYSLPTM